MTPLTIDWWGHPITLLALATAVAGVFGIIRYGTLVNPLTAFVVIEMGMLTVLSAIVAVWIDPFSQLSEYGVRATVAMSTVYLVGGTLPHCFRGPYPAAVVGVVARSLGLESPRLARRFSLAKLALILGAAASAYIALMVNGGGGMLWITNTREAYIGYRAGAGPFYAASQWLLTFAFLYLLWSRRPDTAKAIAWTLLFALAAYLFGSKNFFLIPFIIAIFYRHFMVKPIPGGVLVSVAVVLVPVPFILQLIQGSASDLIGTVLYFRDYFATSAQFLQRFDELGYRWGLASVSELWSIVPRMLYDEKPFEYGVLLIHSVLFPGAAERGHTPGVLPWTLSYLDFGFIGVLFSGIMAGLWRRATYEYFLGHRESFFAFVVMCHFSLLPIWFFAPLPILVVLLSTQAIYLRLRLYRPDSGRVDVRAPALPR
jgi:hypothetical protein